MQQLNLIKAFLLLAIVSQSCSSICSCSSTSNNSSIVNRNLKLKEALNELDDCVIKSVVSFIYNQSYPPKTVEMWRDNNCKNQVEGFKCLKEKSRSLPGLLKRGVQTLVQNRQRHNKKFCSTNNENAKEFVNSMKCVFEKKFTAYNKLESIFANSLLAIRDQNFNESSTELKQLCCTIIKYRKDYLESVEPECQGSKNMIRELSYSTIPEDISLICEDEDKLMTKVCPSLKPLNVTDKFEITKGDSPSVVSMYLIATLGDKD